MLIQTDSSSIILSMVVDESETRSTHSSTRALIIQRFWDKDNSFWISGDSLKNVLHRTTGDHQNNLVSGKHRCSSQSSVGKFANLSHQCANIISIIHHPQLTWPIPHLQPGSYWRTSSAVTGVTCWSLMAMVRPEKVAAIHLFSSCGWGN